MVPPESMIDITQSMACIQCGACVSSCLSMEADPEFIGPAALAKAYRFVGDPRDAETRERLYDLAQDPHGIYDCTHCFSCIDACPKDVAPMDQIMRLRRLATHDHEIDDVNNGHRHEKAFTKIIEKKGTLDESLLLQESYAQGVKGKLMPDSGRDQGAGRIAADRGPRHPHRQDALAVEADPGRSREAPRTTRRTTSSASTSTPRSTARSSTSTSPGEEELEDEGRSSEEAPDARGGASSPSRTRTGEHERAEARLLARAACRAASPPSSTARWRWSPSASGSSWSPSTAPTAAAPA